MFFQSILSGIQRKAGRLHRVENEIDDRRWRIFHRILSQRIRSDLPSGESRLYSLRREAESRHFDSPGHCKSMFPGFCFSRLLWYFSGLQPSRLQRSGKAPCCRLENAFSVNSRKLPVFSTLKMSTLKFLVTIPGRWTICFSFVKLIHAQIQQGR